jgi:hypothetical protein
MEVAVSDEAPAGPAAPTDLGGTGRQLWCSIVDAHELNPAELAVLHQAARTVDELDRMHAALAEAEVIVTGSTGQQKAHPLFDQVRYHRAILARLVAALALPQEEEEVGLTPASRRAQKAVQSRWDQRDRVRALRAGNGPA